MAANASLTRSAGDIRQRHALEQGGGARVDLGVERVAEPRQRVAAGKLLLDAGLGAFALGIFDQRRDAPQVAPPCAGPSSVAMPDRAAAASGAPVDAVTRAAKVDALSS